MSIPTFPLQPPDPEIAFAAALVAFAAGTAQQEDVRALSDLTRNQRRRLQGVWPDLTSEVRREIVRTMDTLQRVNVDLLFGRAFRVALDDGDPQVRQLAVAGLWEDLSFELEARFLELLQRDPSTDVRAETARALGRFAEQAIERDVAAGGADSLRNALLRVAGDESEHELVRCRALESLGIFGGREVGTLIQEAYASDEPSFMTAAVSAMGRSGSGAWLDAIVAVLEDDDIELRQTAATACGLIGDPAAVAELANAALDPERGVRIAALNSLAAIGGKAATRVLETAAGDDDYPDRDVAVDALTRLHDDTILA